MRGSTSYAITFLATSRSFAVKFPVPGPISRTTSVDLMPARTRGRGAGRSSSVTASVELVTGNRTLGTHPLSGRWTRLCVDSSICAGPWTCGILSRLRSLGSPCPSRAAKRRRKEGVLACESEDFPEIRNRTFLTPADATRKAEDIMVPAPFPRPRSPCFPGLPQQLRADCWFTPFSGGNLFEGASK